MADAPSDAAPVEGGEPKSKKLVPLIIILVVMAVEGVGVYALTKFLSPTPQATLAQEAAAVPVDGAVELPKDEHAEIPLVQTRLTNRRGAKTQTISITVSALVELKNKDAIVALVEGMKSRINDRVAAVIRAATDETLDQPGLETLKRQLKSEVDHILGDDRVIREVLVGELIRSGG
jgi:flagellar basal body-associated protein FliL